MNVTEARNRLRAWLADSDQRQDETGYAHITGLFWQASEDTRSEITEALVTLMTQGRADEQEYAAPFLWNNPVPATQVSVLVDHYIKTGAKEPDHLGSLLGTPG